eukprot:CAMPEP_0174825442 /NCGR_PEP_ID=MMETSP1107-20130205/42754_1 /TAXON_ID=36770 /ORGANISM="Paraphysomonas vestita, Strain GFlagA" /LENGTH=211 /DNA_ID=CAMNT_0016057041 /DNA_START=1115 /DNA_END=1751 /DNA_ORIENTATION=-
MNLKDIHDSASSSSSSSEKRKKNPIKEVSESNSADTMDSFYAQPMNNASMSVWSDELTDFHKGNVKLSKLNFQNTPDFNFADVYTSSSDNDNEENDDDEESVYPPEADDDSSLQYHDQVQISNTQYNKQESGDSIHVQDLYPEDNESEIISNISNDDLLSIQSSYDSTLNTTPNSPLQTSGRLSRRASDSQQLRPQQQQFLQIFNLDAQVQ